MLTNFGFLMADPVLGLVLYKPGPMGLTWVKTSVGWWFFEFVRIVCSSFEKISL
jgi:hypothetical protein